MGLDARVNTFIKVVYTLFLDITIFLIRSYFFGHFGFWTFFHKKVKTKSSLQAKEQNRGFIPKNPAHISRSITPSNHPFPVKIDFSEFSPNCVATDLDYDYLIPSLCLRKAETRKNKDRLYLLFAKTSLSLCEVTDADRNKQN